MIITSQELRRTAPALVAGFTIAIVFGAVLSIVLTAAGPGGMALSESRTSGWIALIYGLPMLPSLVLTLRYRQPLLLTGNIFALIFFASLGDRVAFPELAGAAMLAGAVVLATAVLGLTGRIAAWIPVPIVHGLIAGAVLPFVVDIFSSLSTADGDVEVAIMVGSAVLAYLAAQLFLGRRLPAILPAFLVGFLVAALTGHIGSIQALFVLPGLELVAPMFSWSAIATVTPVLVALMTVQSNVPSVIYLRSQGYDPPERLLNVISGGGTLLGSLFGPVTVSLALPPLLLAAGPAAGERSVRYRSIYVPVALSLLIALFAGTAADLAFLIPPVLLLTMAGLALVPALTVALREITAGPLVLGPMFAFTIALSDMSLLGLGPFFWSLVLGTLVSRIFERDSRKELGMSDLGATTSITIDAPIEQVWRALTTQDVIKQWFFGVDTETDWKVGSPLVHRGEYQGNPYQDKGEIVRFDPPELLVHTHWSDVSGTPDRPEHYQEVSWALSARNGTTELTVVESNLPSEEAKAISAQSWRTALDNLKDLLEREDAADPNGET